MDTSISHRVGAPPERIFKLAAAVEEWPARLPHYRYVRVLEMDAQSRTLEMAARRDVVGDVGIPLRWVAQQTVDAESHRIVFRHIAGITRGMWVQWTIDAEGEDGSLVTIRHVFRPRWPVPDALIHALVG